MSRTDLDAATLANSLRMKAGDGSIEWVSEPIQASVLLDIADMLDECGETHLAERHLPWDDDDEYWLYCDECGYWLYMRKSFSRPRYCSHCGRKVVDS